MPRDATRRNLRVVRLAAAMSETGPNVKAASERVAIPAETARYLFKRLMGSGFTMHATIAYEKLGLQCIILVVRLGREFEKHVKEVLSALHDSCYVEAYSRTVPFGYYFMIASVPREHVAAFIGLANRMKTAGLFSSLRVLRSEWRRDIPMRAELYDFERNTWAFDWEHPKMSYDGAREQKPSQRVRFDINDLEILKHRQLDATATLRDISKKIGVQTHSLRYHYRNHLVRRGLIYRYRLDWSRATKQGGEQEQESSKRSYLGLNILATGLNSKQKMEVRAYFSQFPFLTLEAGGAGFYYAEGEIPVQATLQAYKAMDKIGERLGSKLEVFVRDPGTAALFGIATRLFEPKGREWRFDSKVALEEIKRLSGD